MTIHSVFNESISLACTVTARTTAAGTDPPPSTAQMPSPHGPSSEDTAHFSPLAEALSKLGPNSSARADEVFKTLDADGDGAVTKEEFSVNVSKTLGDFRTTQRHAHEDHGHHGRNLDKLFSRIDANGDGTIDKDELAAAVKKVQERKRPALNLDDVFEKIDSNADGTINKDELGVALGLKAAPKPAPASDPTPAPPAAGGVPQTTGSAASAPAPTPASEAAPTTGGAASAPAAAASFSCAFVVSFTAIIQYRSVGEAPVSSLIGTRVNAAA
jgi:Ca2+-binding EF-hand superfamily protein